MRRVLVAVTTALLLVLTAAAPAAAAPTPGSAGLGDPYFPDYGNGGYDVSHYDIRLRYQPATDELSGTTTILAKASQDLSRFNLDFALNVSSVVVNSRPATFTREGPHELVVTPANPVLSGGLMTIVVRYSGVPSTVVVNGFTAWTRTADGALAVGEPEIAWWWFPSNDHPLDKATFDISVLVPNGVEVLSNGVQPAPPRPELIGWTRWFWRSTKPEATYLAYLAIGQYEITRDTAPNGQQVINAYSTSLPETADAARASIERTAEIVAWESTIWGPYPFEAQGGVAGPVDGVGFALETQTRPIYGPGFWRRGANTYVIAHENAHQWFGDSVAVGSWNNIWLNEGFARYTEWLWSEFNGEGTAQELFDFNYANVPADNPFWQVKPGDPGADNVFHIAVYNRGAMTLHQIRLAVGDTAFFQIMQTWAAQQQHSTGTIPQFQALAEQISGKDLDALFTTWLFTAGKPALANASAAARVSSMPAMPKSWPKLMDVTAEHR